MSFLPWEKWLPAWIVGPGMCIGAVTLLALGRKLHWWDYVFLPLAALLGAYATYAWFKSGRHIFRDDEPHPPAGNEDRN
jgi:hypothetical protein